ncbi:hypothetical protein T484DRAFT_1810538, partial [Baffinella frigidus]
MGDDGNDEFSLPGPTADGSDYQLRASLEYYKYYHSQKPLDPRLPAPVYNWSAHVDLLGDDLSEGLANLAVNEESEAGLQPHVDGTDSEFWAENAQFLDPSLEDSGENQDWVEPSAAAQATVPQQVLMRKSVFDRIQEDFPRTPSPVMPQNFATGKPAHSKALPSPSNKGKKNLIETEVRSIENLSASHPALQQLANSSITLPPGMGAPRSATAAAAAAAAAASHLEMVHEAGDGEEEGGGGGGMEQMDVAEQMALLMQQQQLLMQQGMRAQQ